MLHREVGLDSSGKFWEDGLSSKWTTLTLGNSKLQCLPESPSLVMKESSLKGLFQIEVHHLTISKHYTSPTVRIVKLLVLRYLTI